MPRPDPALLDPARYPFSCEIETRFGDLDVNQHINNVALVGLLEEARVRFHRATGFMLPAAGEGPRISSMVASIAVEFLDQTYFPDPLRIFVAFARIGGSSYTLSQLAMQSGRVVAYAQAVMVRMAPDGAARIPDSLREAAAQWTMRP